MAPQRTRGRISLTIVIVMLASTWMIAGLAPAGNAGRPRALGSPTTSPDDDGDGIPNFQEREVAFTSKRHGNKEIYVMNNNGSAVRRLTHNSARDVTPVWSPDRTMLAFASARDGDLEIYVMDAVDGDTAVITQLTDNTAVDTQPAWSNNPHSIAFSSNRDGDFDIYEMDSDDGDNVAQVTNVAGRDISPTWSFDNTNGGARGTLLTSVPCERLAFASNRTGNFDIYVTDGTSTANLTNNPAKDFEPDWAVIAVKSVDDAIFWSSNRDGDLDIFSMDAPECAQSAGRRRVLGNGPNQVIDQPGSQVQPSAHADRMFYAGNQTGNYELYRLLLGEGITKRTNNPALDVNPDQSHFPFGG
jgi:Tol biopolymer transport system component